MGCGTAGQSQQIPRAESSRTLLWDQGHWTRPFIIKRLPRNIELEFRELQRERFRIEEEKY